MIRRRRWCQRWQIVGIAGTEGITAISLGTDTHRSMIDHTTYRIDATNSDTGIHALGVHTSLVRAAVGIEYTLGATALVGIAEVTLAADAGQTSALSLAFGIGSTLQLGTAGRRSKHNR